MQLSPAGRRAKRLPWPCCGRASRPPAVTAPPPLPLTPADGRAAGPPRGKGGNLAHRGRAENRGRERGGRGGDPCEAGQVAGPPNGTGRQRELWNQCGLLSDGHHRQGRVCAGQVSQAGQAGARGEGRPLPRAGRPRAHGAAQPLPQERAQARCACLRRRDVHRALSPAATSPDPLPASAQISTLCCAYLGSQSPTSRRPLRPSPYSAGARRGNDVERALLEGAGPVYSAAHCL